MNQTRWTKIHFDWISLVIWGVDAFLYLFVLLDYAQSIDFQILNWLLMGTVVAFVIGTFAVPARPKFNINPREKSTIISLSLFGFILATIFYVLLEIVVELQFKFSVLDGFDGMGTLLSVSAAINEEVLRWGALRFFGWWRPHLRISPIPIRNIPVSDILTGALVNTMWTFLHASSYVDAPLMVWISLWMAGAVITTMMYLSEHLIVAIAIHGVWNLAVSLNLATILFTTLGVV